MNNTADSETTFKFLVIYMMVRRLQQKPLIFSAHDMALTMGALARYNITIVDLKTFIFSAGSKSQSIDHVVLGPFPKRLLIIMIKNADFNGSVDTNPYKFRHYDIELSLYVKGKLVPIEGLTRDMDHEETTVMSYRTPFEGSGIHHSNSGL